MPRGQTIPQETRDMIRNYYLDRIGLGDSPTRASKDAAKEFGVSKASILKIAGNGIGYLHRMWRRIMVRVHIYHGANSLYGDLPEGFPFPAPGTQLQVRRLL